MAGYTRVPDRDTSSRQPLLADDEEEVDWSQPGRESGRLVQQQRQQASRQEEQLDRLGTSVGTLRIMSRQIGDEVDQQNVLIEDVTQDVDSAQGRMETTMKKMAKVLRIADDRRQWTAIAVLAAILFIIILLFFML